MLKLNYTTYEAIVWNRFVHMKLHLSSMDCWRTVLLTLTDKIYDSDLQQDHNMMHVKITFFKDGGDKVVQNWLLSLNKTRELSWLRGEFGTRFTFGVKNVAVAIFDQNRHLRNLACWFRSYRWSILAKQHWIGSNRRSQTTRVQSTIAVKNGRFFCMYTSKSLVL